MLTTWPFWPRNQSDGTEDTQSGAASLRQLTPENPVDKNPKTQDIDDQRHLVAALEQEIEKLPPHMQTYARGLVMQAQNSLAVGQKVSGTVMSQITQTLNNQELCKMLKTGGILCGMAAGICGGEQVSRGFLCTPAAGSGLFSLNNLRPSFIPSMSPIF